MFLNQLIGEGTKELKNSLIFDFIQG